jgi:hypothetical protein
MAIDFQVCVPREVIKLGQVRDVPGLPVRTLDILGADFRSVDQVLINDVESPEVVVLSRGRLLAQVPEIVTGSNITSVSVLSSQLTITDKSFLSFRISPTPSKVSGILRLCQVFLKLLFTTPGTDIFSKRIGGGALRTLGHNFGKDQGGDIVSGFIISVDNTARQLIQIQGRNSSIPPDERLLSANVYQAGFNRAETALVAGIEILSQAGKAARPRLEL